MHERRGGLVDETAVPKRLAPLTFCGLKDSSETHLIQAKFASFDKILEKLYMRSDLLELVIERLLTDPEKTPWRRPAS